MRIEIRHTTTYRYPAGTRYAIQSLRLTPPSCESQQILDWNIDAPGIESAAVFRDGFGNLVHLAAVAESDDQTIIEAGGTVETLDTSGIVRGTAERVPLRVFLRETPHTMPNEAIRELARSLPGVDPLDRLHALMHAVREAVRYEVGATDAHTSAADALADGRGVCQDHAHLFSSAARVLSIPARYVNGYYLAGEEVVAEAHHAWAEAWVGGLGWVGFDPANGVCPTEHYVRLAVGLDARSAAPIRGIRRGGTGATLDVRVEVQQQVAQ
jgi:transglutaminase-like putative cysteine protease